MSALLIWTVSSVAPARIEVFDCPCCPCLSEALWQMIQLDSKYNALKFLHELPDDWRSRHNKLQWVLLIQVHSVSLSLNQCVSPGLLYIGNCASELGPAPSCFVMHWKQVYCHDSTVISQKGHRMSSHSSWSSALTLLLKCSHIWYRSLKQCPMKYFQYRNYIRKL